MCWSKESSGSAEETALFYKERTLILAHYQFLQAEDAHTAHAQDDLPFIGSVSGLEGLTLALGSWYGFAVAPAVGRFVADHLAGLPTPELDQLTPGRIAHFDPAHVAAFLAKPATANVLE